MLESRILAILHEVRSYLAFSSNDFSWSRWSSREEALTDFDAIVERSDIEALKLLFGPTGSLQEVSISSGWGEKFLELASSFDQAVEAL
jgi:hypothetical protein